LKKPITKKRGGAGGVAQGVGPEFIPQHHEKKKKVKGLVAGPSGRLHVQDPEFKPQNCQKKKFSQLQVLTID
jgi:hypothetical protein